MRCETHCPPASGAAAVVAVIAVAVAVPVALSAVVPFLPAVTITLLALCAAGVAVVRHLVLYGRARKPRTQRQRAPRQTALPVGSSLRAIEAPQQPLEGVIISTRERTRS